MADKNMLFATEDEQAELAKQTADEVATQKYLIFEVDNLTFGVTAESVVEIIINHTITTVPMVPDYIRGIINLRGQIIPLLDIRTRLGKEPSTSGCIIVININDAPTGILVDSVCQMIDIPETKILPIPTHNDQKFVSKMASLPDSQATMLVLDCELLLHDD